jgi:hypothetical protein
LAFTQTEKQFREAAQRHLADAYRLLGDAAARCSCEACSKHRVGAVYLAGYAVECALKAHAIRRRGKTLWEEVVVEEEGKGSRGVRLRGAAGHSLPDLLTAAGLDVTVSPSMHDRWKLLAAAWSVELRYAAGARSRQQVRAVVVAAADVHDWVLRQPT